MTIATRTAQHVDHGPVVPAFEAVEMVFGLGSIVWSVGVGIALLRQSDETASS